MTTPAIAPHDQGTDRPTPRIAHYFCTVQEAMDDRRALCGCPIRGKACKGDELDCLVCDDLVDGHRDHCPPCRERFGKRRLRP